MRFTKEEMQKEMSRGFKCPQCGGKLVEEKILASCIYPDGEFPLHFSICLKCKSEIPEHIGFRWKGRTIAQAKKEWEEFKNDEYLEDDSLF